MTNVQIKDFINNEVKYQMEIAQEDGVQLDNVFLNNIKACGLRTLYFDGKITLKQYERNMKDFGLNF